MDNLTLLLIILICAAFVLIVKNGLNLKTNTKSSAIKKSEIIQAYEEQMKTLLQNYAHDEIKCKEQKMIFLRHVSSELHRNIFFDEDEVKQIIEKLAHL